MCLAIPGKVQSVYEQDGLSMAKVDFGGLTRSVCIECVRDVAPGQFVLVHVGMALSIIDQDEARRALAAFGMEGELAAMAQVESEDGAAP